MKPSPEKDSLNKVWVVLFYLGMIFVPFASLAAIIHFSLKFQPVLALSSSFCWISSSFLINRKPNKLEKTNNYQIRFLWAGIGQAILAISFWTLIKPRTEIAHWASYLNLVLGLMGFLIFYIALISYIFPDLFKKFPKDFKVGKSDELKQEKSMGDDPLSDLPRNLQKLINEGKDAIAKATINVVAIGAFTVMVSAFFLGSTKFPIAILGIETLTVIITVIIVRYFVAQKWQRRAMQSGVPEEELKAAAKLANLWWSKTKSQE